MKSWFKVFFDSVRLCAEARADKPSRNSAKTNLFITRNLKILTDLLPVSWSYLMPHKK